MAILLSKRQMKYLCFLSIAIILISCSQKSKSIEDADCLAFNIMFPEPNVNLPRGDSFRLNYLLIDLAKMGSKILPLTYPSVEIPNIDSLFSTIYSIENELKKDSLAEEKSISICVKIHNLPLNIVTEIMCFLMKNDIVPWSVDFRYEEFLIVLSNKEYTNEYPNEEEYNEYLKSADLKALEGLFNFFPYNRFFFIDSKTNYSTEAKIVKKHKLKTDNFQKELELIKTYIVDFSNSQTENIPIERKAMQIRFDKEIAILKLSKIIHFAQENDLEYDCFYKKGYLNIYTRNEYERSHYYRSEIIP